MQLVVDNLAKSFGVKTIFKNVSFMIDKGEKIGLVGVNGSGKSTLLHCLLQNGYSDSGSVRFEAGTRVGYVEQGFGNIGSGSLWQFMMNSCPEIPEMRRRLQKLEAQAADLKPGEELDKVLDEYASVTRRYEYIDGYNYETRIKIVLNGLGFTEEVWDKPAQNFSGGQKTRILLAAALVKSPDFLILDEPTNHLDIRMTEWLEKYLQDFKGGLLIVSHDRKFLDNVATRILEMEGGHLQSFKGNYTKYMAQKEIQTATLEAAYAAQQDYIARTEAYIRRFKAGIKSKMARGRQSQLDRLERMEAPVHNEEFELKLPPAPESAERVLILDDLTVGYKDNVLVKDISLVLRRGEKAALIGPNGSGKSTLLKTVLGEIAPLKGKAQTGNRVKVGYFSQSYERLDEKQTVLDNFLTEYGMDDGYARSLLGGMLFHGDDVFKEIGTLSGGQKARLVLLKLVLDGANFLILDEPTNYLDVEHIEWLTKFLQNYENAFILISHDISFLNKVVNVIYHLENCELTRYTGNYDKFQEMYAIYKAQKEAAYERQQQEVAKLEDFIARNKARVATTNMAKSRQKKLDKMEMIEKPREKPKAHFHFKEARTPSRYLAVAEDLVLGYDAPLTRPVSFKIECGQKIAIRGVNGLGKTTLLKTILGIIPPISGKIELGQFLEPGYFEQEEREKNENTALEDVWNEYPGMTNYEVRAALAACGLTNEHITSKVFVLSGGEAAKVRLCKLMLKNVNWLVLDEPTNHLDVDAKAELKRALIDFKGSVLLVSHELEFYEDWVTSVWNIEDWTTKII